MQGSRFRLLCKEIYRLKFVTVIFPVVTTVCDM
jgi:hypothetical protein